MNLQGSSIDGAGAGRLKLMKINSLGEESQADSLVFEDTQDGRDNSRSDNTDASTDVYDNLSAPAENSLDVGTNDVDDDEPPPLDDRPPVSENIIGDAQDAHKANDNDDSDDEPPPLDEMPPQSGDVAHGKLLCSFHVQLLLESCVYYRLGTCLRSLLFVASVTIVGGGA